MTIEKKDLLYEKNILQHHPMKRPTITEDMIIADVIDKHPELIDVLFNHGIHCFGCGASTNEMLGDGYKGHYGPDADVKTFIEELNAAIILDTCYKCTQVSSYDEALFRALIEGSERRVCKQCM